MDLFSQIKVHRFSVPTVSHKWTDELIAPVVNQDFLLYSPHIKTVI